MRELCGPFVEVYFFVFGGFLLPWAEIPWGVFTSL
jgi:hypothetical protein